MFPHRRLAFTCQWFAWPRAAPATSALGLAYGPWGCVEGV